MIWEQRETKIERVYMENVGCEGVGSDDFWGIMH